MSAFGRWSRGRCLLLLQSIDPNTSITRDERAPLMYIQKRVTAIDYGTEIFGEISGYESDHHSLDTRSSRADSRARQTDSTRFPICIIAIRRPIMNTLDEVSRLFRTPLYAVIRAFSRFWRHYCAHSFVSTMYLVPHSRSVILY